VAVSGGVLIGMNLSSFFMVMSGMKMVSVRYVRVVGSFFVITFLMMLGCFTVMFGGKLQVFSSFIVMFDAFCHDISPIDPV